MEANEEEKLISKAGNLNTSRWRYCVGISLAVLNTLMEVTSLICIKLITELPPELQLNSLR